MLPSPLYNMEGTSNQMNNSNQSFVFDENVILNCVRNRKKNSELPNCPVCSCTIRQGELESHLTLEVDRLVKVSSGATKRKLSVNSTNGPIAGSSTEMREEEEEVDVTGCTGSDVYQRVHTNRVRRLRARARRPPSPSASASSAPAYGECPVCNARLPTARLRRHALRCLRRSGGGAHLDDDEVPSDSSSEDGSIDVENDEPHASGGFGAEYRWCGVWRVRATALQRPEALGTPVRRASNDTALVVDGDEDTELYGPPQYSPSRIASETPTDATVSERPPEPAAEAELNRPPEQLTNGDCEVRKANGLVEASAETRIQALRMRIRELEARQGAGNDAKCLICLGPHTSPAVSIQCWHVYCEVCWLESLRAKKICPQCNAITSTQHLRRIYM